MKNTLRLFAIGFLFTLICGCGSAGGLFGSAGQGAIASITAEEIIGDAQTAIDASIANSVVGGNQLISHAAFQLDFAVQQIDHKVGIQRKALVKDLDKSIQKALGEVHKLTESLNSLPPTLRSVEDDLYLDLQSTLGNIPFIKSPYVLRQVKGLNQVKLRKTPYEVTLVGTGFGQVTDKRQTEITSFKVNSEDLSESIEIKSRIGNSLNLEIKNDALAPFFKDRLSFAKVNMVVSSQVRKGNDEWKVDKEIPYEFRLYLHPRMAAELVAFGEGEKFDFVEDGLFCHNFESLNNNCTGSCDKSKNFPMGRDYTYYGEVEVPNFKSKPPYEVGNHKLTTQGKSLVHLSGPNTHQNNLDARVIENGRKLAFSFNVWTRPVKYKLCTQKQTYQSTGYAPYEVKIQVPYEDTFKIRLPKDPKLNQFKLILPSGKRINDVVEENRTYLDGRFRILTIENIQNETVVVAQLKPPAYILID